MIGTAERLVAECRGRGLTIATAESLTAGLVAARLADVSGASAVLRGGIVAYATELKHRLLGLDEALLEHVVSEAVAVALAERVRTVMGADIGIGTTGAAGPEPLDGAPPGTVWIAVSVAGTPVASRLLQLSGDRTAVRTGTVEAALTLALAAVEGRE